VTRSAISIAIFVSISAFAQERTAPRHLLGTSAPLTAPSARPAQDISRDFLNSVAPSLALSLDDLAGAYVAREYTDAHNGVTHIVYRQSFLGLDVLNAAYVVNIDSQGQVLNAGGDLYSAPQGPLPSQADSLSAVRAAVKAVNPSLAARFQPFVSQKPGRRNNSVRFAAGDLPDDVEGRPVWYAFRGRLYGAWVFDVLEADGVSRHSVIVDSATQQVFSKRPKTFFQNAQGPRGLVFPQNPQPNPKIGTLVTAPPPNVDRTMQSFAGDPNASPQGWVQNNQTAGNNAIVGENPLGLLPFDQVIPTMSPDGNFSFPLELGAGAPNTLKFTDAVNTNLFYWMNRAHDSFYNIGFTEAAGNFQKENFNKGGTGGDPMYAYSHFGAQAAQRAETINAFFTTMDDYDGGKSFVAMFIGYGGGIYTDGALDSAVMVHEYGHGVSTRSLPSGYDSFQVAAMGEGWSDFYGLEFTLPEGAPPDGVYTIGEYFDQTWAQGDFRSRPYSTNMDVNPLTFASLGKVLPFPEVHADGEIWFLALWDARANLIKQFGEKEGRKRIATLVLDGMKLAPPRSSMIDMRDAILLADRTDYKGASQSQLWAAFAKRGIGTVAFSSSPDTVYSKASFDTPSDRGRIGFSTSQAIIGEPIQVIVHDSNNTAKVVRITLTSSSGDIESLLLKKTGDIFTAPLFTSSNVVNIQNGTLNLMPGDYISAYYDDASAGGGPAQIQATIPTQSTYSVFAQTSPFQFTNEQSIPAYNGAVRVDLPWDFPFYGQTYRSFFVHENGLISFGDTYFYDNFSPCMDAATFSTVPGIAPMFINMTTTGLAQDNEGVYRTRTIGDSVTIRWAGETWTPFSSAGLDGSPLNFAVTLSYDGRIEFRYGKGNTELGSAFVASYCGQGPTLGLSPGHDSYAQTVLLPAYGEGTMLRWDPAVGTNSIPTGIIESPKAGDTVKDVLQISGIAYGTTAEPVSRVNVLVDGIKSTYTTPTVSRTDFCSQQNVPGCPRVGWTAVLNTSTLQPGEHTLQIRVVNSRGGFADYPSDPITFKTEAGTSGVPTGVLESPTEGAVIKGSVTVRGYAYAPTLRVQSADTVVDGATYGPTSYGITRNDICGTITPRPTYCPGIGFQFTLNTRSAAPPLPDGPHTIQVRVRDEAGRYTMIPDAPVTFTVDNGARANVSGAITAPANGDTVSGVIDISGYVYSDTGTVRTGTIYVDDFLSYGTVTLNQPSPDVCAGLPDVPACPNIGFTGQFDTRRLSNGPHTIQVFGSVSTGDTYQLPLYGTPVMQINVKN
jgi:hypothetical protein